MNAHAKQGQDQSCGTRLGLLFESDSSRLDSESMARILAGPPGLLSDGSNLQGLNSGDQILGSIEFEKMC